MYKQLVQQKVPQKCRNIHGEFDQIVELLH